MIYCPPSPQKKINKKINKIPEFYTIFEFLPENAQMLHNDYPKNIFAIFFLGGEARAFPFPRLLRLC